VSWSCADVVVVVVVMAAHSHAVVVFVLVDPYYGVNDDESSLYIVMRRLSLGSRILLGNRREASWLLPWTSSWGAVLFLRTAFLLTPRMPPLSFSSSSFTVVSIGRRRRRRHFLGRAPRRRVCFVLWIFDILLLYGHHRWPLSFLDGSLPPLFFSTHVDDWGPVMRGGWQRVVDVHRVHHSLLD
jgi:hypothetical protein